MCGSANLTRRHGISDIVWLACGQCRHIFVSPHDVGLDRDVKFVMTANREILQRCTSYSRRNGEYLYDIVIYEVSPPANAGRFCAQVVNMVRLVSGQTVAVNAGLQHEYAATSHDAWAQIEAAVDNWVKDQTPATGTSTT